ncbi:uncharacterized protein LOC126354734 [Schistocerca gregaria]|uniref:uncharacterized protein LOC126354734 n=1 Tax=Schistocerca gregaria TaxID=7010 RepID=UPI00211F2A87|nr:uncharacterized protein LOC126354734 [Schistocerca gregaria]
MKLSTKIVKDPTNAAVSENLASEPANLKHWGVCGPKTAPKDAVGSPGIFSQPTQSAVTVAPENVVKAGTHMLAENTAIPLESPDHPVSAVSKSETQTPSDIRNAVVDCACKTDEDSYGLIILCSLCHRWQHGACYRIVREENVPPRFCCFFCNSEETGNICYDQTLIRMDEEQRKEVCLYRKALVYCLSKQRLNLRTFAADLSLSDTQFEKIQKLLEDDNVVAVSRRGTLSHVRTVNNDHLTNVIIPKYFHDVEGSSVVNKAQKTTDNMSLM